MDACHICRNDQGNKLHRAREMMFGMHDEFDYLECAACGCVQIRDIPTDLGKYYPAHYWNFQRTRMRPAERGPLRRRLRHRLAHYWLGSARDPLGRLLAVGKTPPKHISWLRRAGIDDFSAAVLDVGCGLGDRLLSLQQEGFTNLTGIDPYIDADIDYRNGVRVLKRSVYEHAGQYDYITLHHSYEHMPQPKAVMEHLHALCKPGGRVLIRIPLAGSYAWEKYGVNWVQLDAPRHLYLHTPKSLALLAGQTGFEIKDVVYDSDATQFWGSEQYLRDITLYDERSYELHPEKSIFSPEQIAAFRAQVKELNRSGRGDQACFYLHKKR